MAPRDGVLADKDQDQDGAAAAELSGGIEFLVVEDDTLLLSGLRTELRPSSADVDVLLAGSALERFDVDLDYPGGRWVFGCSLLHTDTCRVLPACQQSGGAGPSCR